MARTIRDTNLESKAARMRLSPRHEPYWRMIDPGKHIGYRRGARGGFWKARMLREGGNYAKETLGRADDGNLDADGVDILNFSQAQGRARAWFERQAREAAGLPAQELGSYSVRQAMDDYLAHYGSGHTKGGGRALTTTKKAVDTHILPKLGDTDCSRLTPQTIRGWLSALAQSPARVRTGRGKKQQHRTASDADQDAVRKRKATANRILNILKAALNHAWREGLIASDTAWRRVKPFANVDAPIERHLTPAECVRLVNACPADFRKLVQGALYTGGRYGELVTMRVGDFKTAGGTAWIRPGKIGKGRHVVLEKEGQRFFGQMTAGRQHTELMFIRGNGDPWGKSHQQRPLAEACKSARIVPAASFHVLRHTHGSLLAMKGVPMKVIAQQLGHASTKTTEKHYAHLAPSYVAETIRENFPALGIFKASNVRSLRATQHG